MSSNDAHLYGAKKAPKLRGKEFLSTSSLTFASHLSGLIASSNKSTDPKTASQTTSAGRPRPKKDDIFSVHNKNVKKRALKDLDQADFTQKHATTSESVDDAQWHRAKRRMEEKARLYAALKRGDIEDQDERYAVDFDRKWAEAREKGEGYDTSSGESDNGSDGDEELIDYVDEFGRNVKGTRAQIAREERRKNRPVDDTDRFTARPAMPSNVIYGDTVQSAAFNPDESIAQKMEELAKKRDKELTPPPEEHFDGKREIRTKGVGFFQFSADSEERNRQMAALERERMETEAKREESQKRKNDRRKEIEARRKIIQQKRSQAQADKFLDGLTGEIQAKSHPDPDHGDAG